MVQLEEVEDEEFDRVQVGEKDFNDDDEFTDTGEFPCPSRYYELFPTSHDYLVPLLSLCNPCHRKTLSEANHASSTTLRFAHPISSIFFLPPQAPLLSHQPPHTNLPTPSTDSSISTDSVPTLPSETLSDRFLALRDMVPPSARRRLAYTYDTVKSWGWGGLMLSGKTMWVVSTSALLLGVPFALALVEEQQMAEMEKEQRMREMGNEVS